MEALDAVFTLANKLGGVSFATLMVLILYGSYREIWLWGKAHRERIAGKNKEIAEWKTEAHEWRRVALGLRTLTASAFASAMARPALEQPPSPNEGE